jgi:hypothetical protein
VASSGSNNALLTGEATAREASKKRAKTIRGEWWKTLFRKKCAKTPID